MSSDRPVGGPDFLSRLTEALRAEAELPSEDPGIAAVHMADVLEAADAFARLRSAFEDGSNDILGTVIRLGYAVKHLNSHWDAFKQVTNTERLWDDEPTD